MNIARESICGEFFEMYKQMNESDRDSFSKLCNRLLGSNFIYGQIKKDKDTYYSIIKWQDEIKKYFSLIDYSLEHDSTYKIFFLKSNLSKDRIRLKKMESILMLLCRKFYYIKGKEVNSSVNILVTFDDLVEEINKTQIYRDKLVKGQLADSLKILKRYKVINFDSNNFDETDVFEIYPTILYVVTNMDLKMIDDKLTSYQNADDGDTKDEIDEDQAA